MKLRCLLTIGCMFASVPLYAESPPKLATQNDRLSYSIGVEMARSLKKQNLESNLDLVIQGFKDVQTGTQLLISDHEISKSLTLLQNEIRRKHSPAVKNSADNSKPPDSTVQHAENSARDGVVTLPSGLRYKVLRDSDGKKPVDSDTVVYHYSGTLPNGKQFDGSEKGKPVSIELLQHTSGWREALKMMPTGSVWRFYVPPRLAFEEWKVTRNRKQSEELVFEVELIAIK